MILISNAGVFNELADIRVYPNPTSGNLKIDVSDSKRLNYTITDANGKLLLKGECMDIQNSLELMDLPAGEYFLNISDKTAQNLFHMPWWPTG